MQKKNEQNSSKFPDAKYFLKQIDGERDLYLEANFKAFTFMNNLGGAKSNQSPYQETSDDCTGNLFKKK